MHFLLRYVKYQNIRTSYNGLFQKEEGTNDADLFRVILNPESLSTTKEMCNFIIHPALHHEYCELIFIRGIPIFVVFLSASKPRI